MTEYRISIQKTDELSTEDLKAVIALKQQHWPYSDLQQRQWFRKNIRDDDYHMIIRCGGVIAYLNAVHVDAKIDHSMYQMLGIGNVCVDRGFENRGIGSLLMASANAFIKQSQLDGILLCRDRMVDFYKAAHWGLFSPEAITVAGAPYNDRVMLFCHSAVSFPTEAGILHLSRSF